MSEEKVGLVRLFLGWYTGPWPMGFESPYLHQPAPVAQLDRAAAS